MVSAENRFEQWSTADLAAQCRMQARDGLDPEYEQFMQALSARLLEPLNKSEGDSNMYDQPADLKPLRIDWNKHDLAQAYDLIEGVRRAAAQDPDSPLDTTLREALDAVEAADCQWDGLTYD